MYVHSIIKLEQISLRRADALQDCIEQVLVSLQSKSDTKVDTMGELFSELGGGKRTHTGTDIRKQID